MFYCKWFLYGCFRLFTAILRRASSSEWNYRLIDVTVASFLGVILIDVQYFCMSIIYEYKDFKKIE